MSRRVITIALTSLVAQASLVLSAPLLAQQEPFRPQYHFTPAKHWMNDPNGMVFHEGEWHLFYQFNPFGDTWGHMSWGHAVSKDLVRWQHLPVALPEEGGIMAFSGSAVVDWKNSSGFGRNGKPPMVAVYTGHRDGRQDQRIAYSNDRGRTWTRYAGNPVLDIRKADFRDPKVFWHAGTSRWVMAVVLSPEHVVQFYTSSDLKKWTLASTFGPAGSTDGIWECPDLFEVPVEGGGTRWVLIVNMNPGAPAGGSGTQYFVGTFDGTRFAAEGDVRTPRWADYGSDFYAGVSWNDVPASDGRRVWLGWMSNWTYAQVVPTSPWRSGMTVPRTLSLRPSADGLRLVQRPVRELEALRTGIPRRFVGGSFAQGAAWLAQQRDLPPLLDVEVTLGGMTPRTPVTLQLSTGTDERVAIAIDPANRRLSIDRSRSGEVTFHKAFAATHTAPLRVANGEVSLRLLLDAASLELFAQDGETVMSELFFPKGGARTLSLTAAGEVPRVREIRIHALAPAR